MFILATLGYNRPNFFLARVISMKGSTQSKLTSAIKVFTFVALLACASLDTLAQACNCPSISTCAACDGGLTSLTLRFNGAGASTITVSDQMGVVFSGVVTAGA